MSEVTNQPNSSDACQYSIVIPVYNEDDSLGPLLSEILKVMTPLNERFEVIFVNDGSTDGSLQTMMDFQKRSPGIVEIVNLDERAGQTNALRKGLDAAKGEIVITLDADLQNDPADIPKLLKKMKEGDFDCVCGWRKDRQDTALKAGLSKFGNILQRMFSDLKIHDVSCTLRAYRRRCIADVPLHWEGQHRFIPLGLSLQGYKIGEVVSNHRYRQYGHSKYSHGRIFRVVTDFFKVLETKGKA